MALNVKEWLHRIVTCVRCWGGGDPDSSETVRARAERLAQTYLRHQGLRILTCNFRCKGGEIDIIAQDGAAIVFVEVRLRSSMLYGGAAQSISPAKQRRILHAARFWRAGLGRPYANAPCRFDAVLFVGLDVSEPYWIRGAFTESH